jgi:hypothetical protein
MSLVFYIHWIDSHNVAWVAAEQLTAEGQFVRCCLYCGTSAQCSGSCVYKAPKSYCPKSLSLRLPDSPSTRFFDVATVTQTVICAIERAHSILDVTADKRQPN